MPSSRFSVDPEQGEERDAEEAAEEEPDRESAHDPREPLLHLPHVQESAGLAADEHEPHLERDREQHEEDRRHPDSAGDEDQPGRGVEDGDAEEAHRRDANESRPAGRPGDERGRAGAEDGDGDVGRGQPLRSVRVQEDRVRRDDDEREHDAEGERLRRQQGDDAALGRVAHGALSGELRRRAQTRYELRDHAVGELGPVDEELVEHGLVDPQDEASAPARSLTRRAARARARPARPPSRPGRARRASGRRGAL